MKGRMGGVENSLYYERNTNCRSWQLLGRHVTIHCLSGIKKHINLSTRHIYSKHTWQFAHRTIMVIHKQAHQYIKRCIPVSHGRVLWWFHHILNIFKRKPQFAILRILPSLPTLFHRKYSPGHPRRCNWIQN